MLNRIILGLLLYRSLSMYDLKKAIEQTVGFFYSSSYGNIQPSLKKLEAERLVNVRQQVINGRNRNEYTITPKGREQFIHWLSQDISIGRIQDEGLLRLFFLAELPQEKRIGIMTGYAEKLRVKISELKHVEQAAKQTRCSPEQQEALFFRLATLDFGIRYYQFELTWYEILIAGIRKKHVKP